MKILLDQNMSRLAASILRQQGFDAQNVHDLDLLDASDAAIWTACVNTKAVLFTRDHHFANRLRYNPAACGGIVIVSPGNLKIADEIELIVNFLHHSWAENMSECLVLLSPTQIRIRE